MVTRGANRSLVVAGRIVIVLAAPNVDAIRQLG